MSATKGGIVVFSGGSAANSLVDIFESIRKAQACPLSYIIPISDNGGSTSEIIRVFGGPGIGDVRSRLVRLIPQQPYSREREAISRILSYRLSSTDGREARLDWADIVDGTSSLWKGVSSAKKELLRSFFNLLNLEILKRSRPPSSTFDFRSASIGNLFLTGARLFSGSFESAIYLLSAICGIPDDEVRVIPSINSNFSHHIAAELEDGSTIVGQNSISHPVDAADVSGHGRPPTATPNGALTPQGPRTQFEAHPPTTFLRLSQEEDSLDITEEQEDAHPPFTLPTLRTSNIVFTKAPERVSQLPSRISRIYYVNSFGQEILPPSNPRASQAILHAQSIIYSIGSLYTSIAPNLVLRGIGDSLRRSRARVKILILNGCLDREVGPDTPSRPYTAFDFVNAIVKAGEQSRGVVWRAEDAVSSQSLQVAQINQVETPLHPALVRSKSDGVPTRQTPASTSRILPPPMPASAIPSRTATPSSSPERSPAMPGTPQMQGRSANQADPIYQHYVTHLVHLTNSIDRPHVDGDLLARRCGIVCVSSAGQQSKTGPEMVYDVIGLQRVLASIIGQVNERLEHPIFTASGAVSAPQHRGRSQTVNH